MPVVRTQRYVESCRLPDDVWQRMIVEAPGTARYFMERWERNVPIWGKRHE